MQIGEYKVVTLSYKLSNHATGEKIEETTQDNPLVFLYGVGQMIPDFESNIFGLNIGDNFEFSISHEKAYGAESPENVVNIPIDVFNKENGELDTDLLKEGAVIPMTDSEGNTLRGKVVEIKERIVKMDFNHPLAGADLHFTGRVEAIREATSDELAHGHVHGPDGHHH